MESKMRVVISDLDCYVMAHGEIEEEIHVEKSRGENGQAEGKKNSKPVSFGRAMVDGGVLSIRNIRN
jgi:hypothetical protein